MSLSEFYESTIEKVEVHFGFDGFNFAPNEITEVLGITPSETRVKGESYKNKAGKIVHIRDNSWSISSSSSSKDVNVHMRQLINKLDGKKNVINPDWNPGFSVVWRGNNLYAGSGPFYERDVLEGIASLKAELWHDIYQSLND